jgi:sugar phosphate isomerase/epimerase
MRGQSWETVCDGHKREDVEEWIAADLKVCAEQGKKCGVIIGVQNHGDFLRTGENLVNLVKRVDSDWCGAIVDTGYFRTKDPYEDMAQAAPYAVNWQIKESPFGVESDVHTDLKRLIGIIRASGYRGYLPIEGLSARGKEYDPYTAVPKLLTALREAIDGSAKS